MFVSDPIAKLSRWGVWGHAVAFSFAGIGDKTQFATVMLESKFPSLSAAVIGTTLTDQQIRDALAYIKRRWSPRVREAQVQMQRRRGR